MNLKSMLNSIILIVSVANIVTFVLYERERDLEHGRSSKSDRYSILSKVLTFILVIVGIFTLYVMRK